MGLVLIFGGMKKHRKERNVHHDGLKLLDDTTVNPVTRTPARPPQPHMNISARDKKMCKENRMHLCRPY